jgi:hypothetical protein
MALIQLIDNETITESLVIPKGVDYQQLFTIRETESNLPIDFSGFSSHIITSKIKQFPESVSFAATFTATFSDATNGVVKLSLTDIQTDVIKRGRYFYDVVLTLESKASADEDSDLQTVRLAQGGVVIV